MTIQPKNLDVLESMHVVAHHPTLIELEKWVCARYSSVTWTCGFEDRDYPSVHSTDPLRGVDIRSRVYGNPKVIVDDINRHWIYDPARPEMQVAIYHDTGRGPHIHLQVHPNTRLT